MIERRIASRRPGSTSTSWNIWRRSPSASDSVRHLATARPGRLDGTSCNASINLRRGLVVGCNGLTMPRSGFCNHLRYESPCVNLRVLVYPVPSQSGEASVCSMITYSVLGPARGSHSLHLTFLPRKFMRGLCRSQSMVATLLPSLSASTTVRLSSLEMK